MAQDAEWKSLSARAEGEGLQTRHRCWNNCASELELFFAIQREFVWLPNKVIRLFDSLMRGYPISLFLFWDLKPENRDRWQAYKFVEDARMGGTHNELANIDGVQQLTLVLDGQQRLTSLLLGLKGTYTTKKKYKKKKSADAWSRQRLYLNLLKDPRVPEEDGEQGVSIRLASVQQEKALALWANTSLGLLLSWYNANKQQSDRGSVGVLALQDIPVLDITALSPPQLAAAVQLFDAMSALDLLSLHEIDTDPVRRDLDINLARDVLGLPESIMKPGGPLELLRMKLAREPSIRGLKA